MSHTTDSTRLLQQNQTRNMTQKRDYTQIAQESKLLQDDYEITTNRIDWNKVAYGTRQHIQRIQLVEGTDDQLLAPQSDITAIFMDPTDSIAIAESFITILETRTQEQLAYILTLLSHILQQDTRRGKVFLQLNNENLLQSFSRVWLNSKMSHYTAGKSAICASIILKYANEYAKILNNNEKEKCGTDDNKINLLIKTKREKYIGDYKHVCSWMLREFRDNKNDKLLFSLYALKGIISNADFQSIFCGENGIERLFEILTNNGEHRQVAYLVVYCLWALSFHKEHANHDGLLNGQLINKLVKLAKITKQKNKKITRVIFQMFENLLGQGNFNEMVVLFGLYPILDDMEEEKEDDPELKTSVKQLSEKLSHSVKILSSFERYQQELRSDKLSWGPCHTESFWKKYSHKFEEDDYNMIQGIIKLLRSHDEETIAVACYDLGEWSRFYPDAKRVIEKFKGKFQMMELIQHPDADVKKHAISAVQKLLIKRWEALDDAK